jgi:hypothetical protein
MSDPGPKRYNYKGQNFLLCPIKHNQNVMMDTALWVAPPLLRRGWLPGLVVRLGLRLRLIGT